MAKPSIRRKFRDALFGAPRDPFNKDMRQHIALAAFMAWVGLGADGLSSANYGPAEAFLALGANTHLALYLAAATAITVFVIALCYNQVIALFPGGGGGYKIASRLIHPTAGAVSGSALIIDYMLTIAISVASGMDALFSLLPLAWQPYKISVAAGLILLLIWLNMRGVKESVRVLLPVFLGFVITHAYLIIHGIIAHADRLPGLIPDTVAKTQGLSLEMGWVFVLALFFKAFSMGGGTYTGLEAVSNNVCNLAEPRVRTAQW
ncbi:MAG: APC family permease, partial [Alphaproteobacteria bacterium]|nr:APC family permease [Alphaproteobacteria bacterium]